MRKMWIVTLAFYSAFAFAHGDESRVGIEFENGSSVFQAGAVGFSFDLIDLKLKQVLTPANLNIVHEKKIHLFLFDAALKEFYHEHPEFVGGKWRVKIPVSKRGNYWLWTQGELSIDKEEFASGVEISLTGGLPANPAPPQLTDIRKGTDGNARAELSPGRIQAKKHVMLNLTFSRTDETIPSLQEWLGAGAHLIAVLNDGDVLVHTHTTSTPNPHMLQVHALFEEAGMYRIWIQYLDGGILRTVPIAVKVWP